MGRHRQTLAVNATTSQGLAASRSMARDILGPEPRSGPICFWTVCLCFKLTSFVPRSDLQAFYRLRPGGATQLSPALQPWEAVRRTVVPEARHRQINRKK